MDKYFTVKRTTKPQQVKYYFGPVAESAVYVENVTPVGNDAVVNVRIYRDKDYKLVRLFSGAELIKLTKFEKFIYKLIY